MSEESVLRCGIILWGPLSHHLLSIAWLVSPTWTCHLCPIPVALPASTVHSPQPDGTLDLGLGLVGTEGTWFCLRIFSALLIGQLRVLHTSTVVSTCEQEHPKKQLVTS